MLTKEQATIVVKKALPDGNVQRVVEYRDLYLFQVFTSSPGEEDMDPFYSVNRETGEFREFSILTDGNITDITELFTKEA